MAIVARLRIGDRSSAPILDLTTGPFRIDESFSPPSAVIEPLLGEATSVNRYEGSTKLSEKAQDMHFNLPVQIRGTTNAEIQGHARRLVAFLRNGLLDNQPLYFEYRRHGDLPEPIWGTLGLNQRFEIVHASVPGVDFRWGEGTIRDRLVIYTSRLTVKPFITGTRQLLATATGAVGEDLLGYTDGLSRGLYVLEAGDNFIDNPSFRVDTAFWTAQSTNVIERSSDFSYHGDYSLKCTYKGTSINLVQTDPITLTASVYTVGCFVYIPSSYDGTAPLIQAIEYAGFTLTDTIFADLTKRDQWQRMEQHFTVAAGDLVGSVVVQMGGVPTTDTFIYVDGFQVTLESPMRQYFDGDSLGGSWAGTRHDSRSTIVDGVARLDVAEIGMDTAAFTIRLICRCYRGTAHNHQNRPRQYFSLNGTNELQLTFSSAAGVFELEDATNNALSSSGRTYAEGDIQILHAVAGQNGLALYLDGVSIGTDTAYIIVIGTVFLYLGADPAGIVFSDVSFMDCTIWNHEMTAAEVSDDYDAVSPAAAASVIAGPVPWLHTRDSAGNVDNVWYDDETKQNFAVIGGIPGTDEAEINLEMDMGTSWTNNRIWLSRLATNEYFHPRNMVEDFSLHGTVTPSGPTIGTAMAVVDEMTMDYWALRAVAGSLYNVFAALEDPVATPNVFIAGTFSVKAIQTILSAKKPVQLSTVNGEIFICPPLTLLQGDGRSSPWLDVDVEPAVAADRYQMGVAAERISGSAEIRAWYLLLAVKPLMELSSGVATDASTAFRFDRGRAHSGTDEPGEFLEVNGDILTLEPNKYNFIYNLLGFEEGTWSIASDILTYNRMYVYPRWSLI